MIALASIAALVSILSILGFLGSWWWIFDLLSSFRHQYAVTLLLLGLACLLGRWRKTGAAVTAVGLLNLAVVVPLFIPEELSASGERISVLSFNVSASNESYGEVIDYIRETEPDFVFLHEATRFWRSALEDAGLGYRIVEGRSEDMIFSTLVMAPDHTEIRSHGFSEEAPRSIEVTYRSDTGVEIAILGIHPVSPDTERRASLRDAQLALASSWGRERTSRAVIVGDFNASPWSAAFRKLLSETGFESSQNGFGIQASFPADRTPLIRVPIDHLIHSRGLTTVDRVLGPRLSSDHFPLLVVLAVTE